MQLVNRSEHSRAHLKSTLQYRLNFLLTMIFLSAIQTRLWFEWLSVMLRCASSSAACWNLPNPLPSLPNLPKALKRRIRIRRIPLLQLQRTVLLKQKTRSPANRKPVSPFCRMALAVPSSHTHFSCKMPGSLLRKLRQKISATLRTRLKQTNHLKRSLTSAARTSLNLWKLTCFQLRCLTKNFRKAASPVAKQCFLCLTECALFVLRLNQSRKLKLVS
mmetsp:Transcript_27493/g.38852  ORF Transcript_27493/g.38852 Transcript_27493/m.38852 type:complete len:218 (-) Transcript_27493:2034-2687(-)